MLKAFVGIASDQGLTMLHPERDETLSLIRQSVENGGHRRVGFWAVLDDTEARCVQVLLLCGQRQEAMRFLDSAAKDMGRILLNSAVKSRLH